MDTCDWVKLVHAVSIPFKHHFLKSAQTVCIYGSSLQKLINPWTLLFTGDETPSGFPEEILSLEALEYLSLQYQGIVGVPNGIQRLSKLSVLNVSHNPNLLSVSAHAGNLPLKRRLACLVLKCMIAALCSMESIMTNGKFYKSCLNCEKFCKLTWHLLMSLYAIYIYAKILLFLYSLQLWMWPFS